MKFALILVAILLFLAPFAYIAKRNIIWTIRIGEDLSKHRYEMFCRWLPDATLIYVNDAYCRMMGKTRKELIGTRWTEIVLEGELDVNLILAGFTPDNPLYTYEHRVKTNDEFGNRWHQWTDQAIFKNGKLVEVHSVGIDITSLKQAHEELQVAKYHLELLVSERTKALMQSEQRYYTIFNSPMDCIFISDISGNILEVNAVTQEVLGYSAHELEELPLELLVTEKHRRYCRNTASACLSRKQMTYECEMLTKNGRVIPMEVKARVMEYAGELAILSIVRDITERKKDQEYMVYMTQHDALTGLFNRSYFEDCMRWFQEDKPATMGIIMCDVDGLKFINDTLGHEAGDELLRDLSSVLLTCFRKGDVVARIGGDEFAVLLPGVSLERVKALQSGIAKSIAKHNISQSNSPISASVGYAFGQDGYTLKQLFREADNNMYREKLNQRQSSRSSIVQALMKTLEARDLITDGHADRMLELVASMCQFMNMDNTQINNMALFAQFHDIGKVGIPDRILFKPGKLSDEEMREMRRHSEIGYRIAMSTPDLEPIADWILKHHEWWNGNGYPFGLCGQAIPLPCRVLAIMDAYDAMTSDRPYRYAMSHKDAIQEIVNCSGVQFDPELVDIFLDMASKRRISSVSGLTLPDGRCYH